MYVAAGPFVGNEGWAHGKVAMAPVLELLFRVMDDVHLTERLCTHALACIATLCAQSEAIALHVALSTACNIVVKCLHSLKSSEPAITSALNVVRKCAQWACVADVWRLHHSTGASACELQVNSQQDDAGDDDEVSAFGEFAAGHGGGQEYGVIDSIMLHLHWAASADIASMCCDILSLLVTDRFDDADDCCTTAWLAAQYNTPALSPPGLNFTRSACTPLLASPRSPTQQLHTPCRML